MPIAPKTIFFAHAEEDFEFVKMAATSLEALGYRCWYYERNTVAGKSYLAQIHDAMLASSFVVLIVSKSSLASVHVSREVELAYEKGRKIIPLCRDATGDQIETMQPTWSLILGTVVRIESSESNEQIEKLRKCLSSLGIRQPKPGKLVRDNFVTTVSRPDKRTLGSTPPWASDGTQVDISSLKNVVFRTQLVDQFISSDQKLFVCGTKGLGKTLLLRFKRFLITEQHSRRTAGSNQSDVLFIPTDQPFIDMMTDLPTLSDNHHQFLRELKNCKRLWAFSIRFSVISYVRRAASDLMKLLRNRLPPIFEAWLTANPVEPSVVFKQMLALPVKQLNSLLDHGEGSLDHTMRNINRAVYVFIDKVDQGVAELQREQWCNVQGGLLEAAWDASSCNAHVKVFGTIRDEAFASYQSAIKANVSSCLVSLAYSSNDLRQLIDSLAVAYEGVEDFASFVHRANVRNTRSGIVEDCFEYLARHTVGRPRDFVRICSALSALGDGITERQFRNKVNEFAASEIVSTLFAELAAFLNGLKTPEDRAGFFALIPYNILTKDEVRELSREFNGSAGQKKRDEMGFDESWVNPFLELWSCGLLGVVGDDFVDDQRMQKFKLPHESFRLDTKQLPDSPYYLIHPSLHALIKEQRADDGYRVFKYVVVGNGCRWHRHDPIMIDLQREAFKFADNERLLKTLESALPFLHAAWSEKRSLGEFMPSTQKTQLEALSSEFNDPSYDALWQALNVAWSDWGQPAATSPPKVRTKKARQ